MLGMNGAAVSKTFSMLMMFPNVQYAIATLLASFSLLYFACAPFRFYLKLAAYHLYLLVAASCMIPMMAYNGRSRKNIWLCSQALALGGWLFGVQGKVLHPENLIQDDCPFIVVSNHQSSLDFIGMGKIFNPNSTFLSKKELLYCGPFGLALWLSGGLFINRSDSKQSIDTISKTATMLKRENLNIWIFPEGTRNTKLDMLPFKKGAFYLAVEAGVPIVPVVFSSFKSFYDPNFHVFESGSYVIDVLPPVSTENILRENVPDLTNRVRNSMIETFHKISLMELSKLR